MASRNNQRILIVRPSALGDVCRTAPVLASLRAALPDTYLAWVVQDDFAPAIEAHPALDEVIAFPRRRFGHWWKSPSRAAELQRWFRLLRRKRFDVALDCQGLSRSGLIARASGAQLRVGLRSARELAWVCYNRRVPENGTPLPVHTVERMLCVLEPLGVPAVRDMRLYAPHASVLWWKSQREALGLSEGTPYAVIAPGSRWLSKRWPIERFEELIEPLLKRGFAKVIVIGSAPEREQIAPMFEGIRCQVSGVRDGVAAAPIADTCHLTPDTSPVVDLVGRTTIAQTMAIVAGAGIVIANDSAPLHMAVGFDRPCIGLFGPTDPEMVGPYGRAECVVRAYAAPKHDGAAQPNFKDEKLGDSLMRLISTAMVLQSIDRVLTLWPQRETGVRNQLSGVRGERAVQDLAPDPLSPSLARGLEPKAAS